MLLTPTFNGMEFKLHKGRGLRSDGYKNEVIVCPQGCQNRWENQSQRL
jgi:hypothetical protein